MSEHQTNNSLKPSDEITEQLLILRSKLEDEEWRGQQDIEFVEALAQALAIIGFLAEETQKILESAFTFMREVTESALVVNPNDSDVSTPPTQTSGSRATRRARERVKKTPVSTHSNGAENA